MDQIGLQQDQQPGHLPVIQGKMPAVAAVEPFAPAL